MAVKPRRIVRAKPDDVFSVLTILQIVRETPRLGPAERCKLGVVMALFIAYTHRSNLARLRAGTEPRFERARIWARLRRGAA